MPKICYVPKTFNAEHERIITQANAILINYEKQGFDLTLRQLYYQFVSRDLFPTDWADKSTGSTNNERSYKKLGSIVNDARLAGHIDWTHITDRTRSMKQNAHWENPEAIIDVCARSYRIDRWENQKNYVEVWVEKDALVGVLEVACTPLDVPYFSCRGYTSQSEMWVAAMRLLKRVEAGKHVHIIHLGDHDPSGIDMTRDIRDRISIFIGKHSKRVSWFELSRVALNMPQIKEYAPPPNPTKLTDSRAAMYLEDFGEECWELDALEPSVLTALIQNHVGELRDVDQWAQDEDRENMGKIQLKTCYDRWADVEALLAEIQE